MQYGAPTYSLSAESSNPIICEPPPPPISNIQTKIRKLKILIMIMMI